MSYPSPSQWSDQLWRATIVVLLTALSVYLAWRLLSAVLGPLVILAGLLLVFRLAAGRLRSRREW